MPPREERAMHRMRESFGVGLLLILIFTLSGCGSSNSSPTPTGVPASTAQSPAANMPPPNVDVCALVTAQEMSQIVGETVTAKGKTLQTGIPACTYRAASGNPIPGVTMAIHKPNAKATYNMALAAYKKSDKYREVTGIGEQ